MPAVEGKLGEKADAAMEEKPASEHGPPVTEEEAKATVAEETPAVAQEASVSPGAADLSAEQLSKVKEAFDAIDTNKSGFIERSEFKDVMEALGMKMSQEEVTQVFKSFDVNDNQKLEFQEYVQLIKEAMKEQPCK